MKNLAQYFKYKEVAIRVLQVINIAIGIAFILIGVLLTFYSTSTYKPAFLLICLGAIVNVFLAVFLHKYYKVVIEATKEIELLGTKMQIEAEYKYQEEQKELIKIQKKNEEQLAKLRNPFSVGDKVKNKLNIYSKDSGETIPAGTEGSVIESLNDGTIKVRFVINGKKVVVFEKIDIFKKIY